MTTFNQTGTDFTTCTNQQYCSGNTVNTGGTDDREASEGGTGSAVDVTPSIDASANNLDAIWFWLVDGTNNLEDLDGASGDWSCSINVGQSNMNLNWTGFTACRINSSCVNQETLVSDQTFTQDLGSTGVKTQTGMSQASATTIAAGDFISCQLAFDNADTMMAQAFKFDPDQTIVNQWAAAPEPFFETQLELLGVGA